MTKPTRTDLADRVQALRLAKGLTQADLAAQIGLTERSVRYIENGKTRLPSLATVDALAAVLGVEPDRLIVHPARGKPPKPVSELGERLRFLRQQRGLSQDELAARIGKARSSIRNLEDGTVERPHQRLVDAIAVALGVSPDDLTTATIDAPTPALRYEPPRQKPIQTAPSPRTRRTRRTPPATLRRLAEAVQAYDPDALVVAGHIESDIGLSGMDAVCVLFEHGEIALFRNRDHWIEWLTHHGEAGRLREALDAAAQLPAPPPPPAPSSARVQPSIRF